MTSLVHKKPQPIVAGATARAGFFGDSLVISDTLEHIDVIEFVQALQKRLNNFEQLVSASFPPLGQLSARQTLPASEGAAWFDIDVAGFRPYVDVYINSSCIHTDYSGSVTARLQLACAAGATIQITAFDPLHPKGTQYSNTLSLLCR